MAYLFTPSIQFPLREYTVNSYAFREKCSYDGVFWGVHLGEDIDISAGTNVYCIGRGKVVYSDLHAGSREKKNWGNIVIIAHKNPSTKKVFFSLYAHMQNRLYKTGDRIEKNCIIGVVGKSYTPENGFWPEAHLHFSIYTGFWNGKVLPGYWKKGDKRTKLEFWQKPSAFISNYQI